MESRRLASFNLRCARKLWNQALEAETAIEVDDPLLRLLTRMRMLRPADRFRGNFEPSSSDLREPARTWRCLKALLTPCTKRSMGDEYAALASSWLADVDIGFGVFYQLAKVTLQLLTAVAASIDAQPRNGDFTASLMQTLAICLPHALFSIWCFWSAAGDRLEGLFQSLQSLIVAVAVVLQYCATTSEDASLLSASATLLAAACVAPFILVAYDVVVLPALTCCFQFNGRRRLSGAVRAGRRLIFPKPGLSRASDRRTSLASRRGSSIMASFDMLRRRPSSGSPSPLSRSNSRSYTPRPLFGRHSKRKMREAEEQAAKDSAAKKRATLNFGKIRSRLNATKAVVSMVAITEESRGASVHLQSTWRRFQARKRLRFELAKSERAQERKAIEQSAAVRLQAVMRGNLARRPEVIELARLHKVCTAFQRAWRTKNGIPIPSPPKKTMSFLLSRATQDDAAFAICACGETLSPTAQFCSSCGAPRRLPPLQQGDSTGEENAEENAEEDIQGGRSSRRSRSSSMRRSSSVSSAAVDSSELAGPEEPDEDEAEHAPAAEATATSDIDEETARPSSAFTEITTPKFKAYVPDRESGDDADDGSEHEEGDVFFAHFSHFDA
jgi:hypothetical protein